MSGLINFIKSILGFEPDSEIIGLAKFSSTSDIIAGNKLEIRAKKERTLTEMLRKNY